MVSFRRQEYNPKFIGKNDFTLKILPPYFPTQRKNNGVTPKLNPKSIIIFFSLTTLQDKSTEGILFHCIYTRLSKNTLCHLYIELVLSWLRYPYVSIKLQTYRNFSATKPPINFFLYVKPVISRTSHLKNSTRWSSAPLFRTHTKPNTP